MIGVKPPLIDILEPILIRKSTYFPKASLIFMGIFSISSTMKSKSLSSTEASASAEQIASVTPFKSQHLSMMIALLIFRRQTGAV